MISVLKLVYCTVIRVLKRILSNVVFEWVRLMFESSEGYDHPSETFLLRLAPLGKRQILDPAATTFTSHTAQMSTKWYKVSSCQTLGGPKLSPGLTIINESRSWVVVCSHFTQNAVRVEPPDISTCNQFLCSLSFQEPSLTGHHSVPNTSQVDTKKWCKEWSFSAPQQLLNVLSIFVFSKTFQLDYTRWIKTRK